MRSTWSAARMAGTMLGAATMFVVTSPAFAGQCNDPWVTQVVIKYLHRPPSGPNAPECNIYLYRSGHWNSFSELDAAAAAYWTTHPAPAAPAPVAGQCGDPWVTRAVQQVMGRPPAGSGNDGECSIYRYGGGHWTSYDDLVGKVRVAFGRAQPQQPPTLNLGVKASDFTVPSTALGYSQGRAPAQGRTVSYQGRQYQVVNVVAQGGGNLITDNGGGLLSTNGGNLMVTLRLISSDSAGVVGPGGSSVMINNGANMQSPQYRH